MISHSSVRVALLLGAASGIGQSALAQDIEARLRTWRARHTLELLANDKAPTGVAPLIITPYWRDLAHMSASLENAARLSALTSASVPTNTPGRVRQRQELTLVPATPDSRPKNIRLAQVGSTPENPARTPDAPLPADDPTLPATPRKSRQRQEITLYVNTSFGFDRQSLINTDSGPVEIEDRRINRLTVTGEYPLASRTDISLSVPYVYQTARTTSVSGTLRQTGQGLGDLDLYLSHRFPEIGRGLRLSAGVGMVLPTGKAFNLRPDQLRTGTGYYQPYVNVSVRKLMVPLQLFANFDYGTSLSRRVDGEKTRLPDSYGGELGFYYALGPQFNTRTSLSVSQTSSPFVGAPGSTTAYLTQGLTYYSGNSTVISGSIDAGLTDDSTDAYLSLTVVKTY